MKDYEQLYYDSLYEIKILKKKIKYLEDLVNESNNSDLKKYIVNQLLEIYKNNRR